MTPERWRRIEQLYHSALACEGGKRAAYLDEACAGDEELRCEVESLLENAEQSTGRVDGHALEAAIGDHISFVALDLSGKKLGRYEVMTRLGGGGMGEVYRARDTRLGRDVALKVLRPESVADPGRKRRFEREARAASALNHANIVAIYDIDQAEGIDFIAMEYVRGQTLDRLIGRNGLPLRDGLKYGIEIASALAAAHGAGIVHRDLKPGNIMVDDSGQVKVLDFGLAKLTEREYGETVTKQTETGAVMGTAAYMSPEQAQGKHVDARSDIFSFGSVLYEMVTGRRAFPGDTPIEAMAAILNQEPAALGAEVPRDLDKVIARCLRKDPARRIQHMDDVKLALEELREEPASVMARQAAQTLWRRPLWVWVAAAFVLIGATAGIGWWWIAYLAWDSRIASQPPTSLPLLRQLTWDAGLATDPAASPDGKLLAFASDRSGEGNLDIWVQELTGGEPKRLTDHPTDDHEPSFSPDGSRIVFRSEREGGGIYVVSALGGDARLLAKGGHWPHYSPAGSLIAYGVGSGQFRFFVIPVIPIAGEPWQVSDMLGDERLGMAWSPDGTSLIVVGSDPHTPSAEPLDWWVVSAAHRSSGPGSAVKTGALAWLRGYGLDGVALPLVWLRDRIIFTAARGDRANIWEIPFSARVFRVNGAPRRLTFGAGNESRAVLTAGGRLVFASDPFILGLWELPVEPNQGKVQGELRSLGSHGGPALPTLSADGKKLAFTSHWMGNPDVRLRDLESGKETALTTSFGQGVGPVISRDGSAVIYRLWRKGIYSIPTAGGVPQMLCGSCDYPSDWSMDRTKVLFQSRLNNTRSTIGLLDCVTGEKVEILKHARYDIYRGHFSPDERWLVFHAYDPSHAAREFIAPFRGARVIREDEWIPLTDGKAYADAPRWSPDGNLVYYVSDRDGFRCIWAQRLEPATKKPVGDPFVVQHFHQRQRSIRDVSPTSFDLTVAGGRLVFTMIARRGNIFMADFGKSLP